MFNFLHSFVLIFFSKSSQGRRPQHGVRSHWEHCHHRLYHHFSVVVLIVIIIIIIIVVVIIIINEQQQGLAIYKAVQQGKILSVWHSC